MAKIVLRPSQPATPKTIAPVTRPVAPVAPPSPPPAQVQELEAVLTQQESAELYASMPIADLRAYADQRAVPHAGKRKSQLVVDLMKADGFETEGMSVQMDEEGTDVVPPPSPAKKPVTLNAASKSVPIHSVKPKAPMQRVTPPPAPEPELEEEVEPIPAVTSVAAQGSPPALIAEIVAALNAGQTLYVSRVDDATLTVTFLNGDAPAATPDVSIGRKLRGEQYWNEVLSPEYNAWMNVDAGAGKPWKDMTNEEKEAYAKSLGLVWEASNDARITGLNIVRAVMKHFSMSKYKPQYASKRMRDSLKK